MIVQCQNCCSEMVYVYLHEIKANASWYKNRFLELFSIENRYMSNAIRYSLKLDINFTQIISYVYLKTSE